MTPRKMNMELYLPMYLIDAVNRIHALCKVIIDVVHGKDERKIISISSAYICIIRNELLFKNPEDASSIIPFVRDTIITMYNHVKAEPGLFYKDGIYFTLNKLVNMVI